MGCDGILSRSGGRNCNFTSTNKEVTSMYVSEFPEACTTRELFDLFGCSGHVVEVAISPRRNTFGKRFCFAWFLDAGDGMLLAVRLHNTIIDGRKIHVNLPHFQRATYRTGGRMHGATKGMQGRASMSYEEKNKVSFWAESSRNPFKSYVEAVVDENFIQKVKEDDNILLNFHSNVASRSRFEKAYVGNVCIPVSAYNIQTHLEMEGVFAIKITPLGGNCCLLKELEEGFIADLISEGEIWCKTWFTEVKKWEAGMGDDCRDAWFRIYGILAHVWNYDFLSHWLQNGEGLFVSMSIHRKGKFSMLQESWLTFISHL